MNKYEILVELIKWLNGEKYLINDNSCTMTEEFEKEHQWELSRNRMIDKTINKIIELDSQQDTEETIKNKQFRCSTDKLEESANHYINIRKVCKDNGVTHE